MTRSQIEIRSQDLTKFMNFIKDNIEYDYENNNSNMSIIVAEDYYFIAGSVQLNLIIAKLENSLITVDLIGNNVGRLMERIIGTEKAFINKMIKIINKYIEANNLEYGVKMGKEIIGT